MVLKLKITIQYINDIASPDIRILPSRFSSPKIRSRSASLIPAHLLNLLLSIWPPLLVMIQRIRSRGDCEDLGTLLTFQFFPLIVQCLDLPVLDHDKGLYIGNQEGYAVKCERIAGGSFQELVFIAYPYFFNEDLQCE